MRWKGDTSDQIPVVPAWETHPGITEDTVAAFTASIRSTNPPGTDVPPEHARYGWMIERCSDRDVAGSPVRHSSWVRMASGYSATPYLTTKQAAVDILDCWFRWNRIFDPRIRVLHTIWVRHATDAAWAERLDGR